MTESAGAHAEVVAVNARFYHAFETADLDLMRSLWLADPETVCVHPGARPIRGRQAIDRSWAVIMANTSYIQFILTEVEVSLGDGVATLTCTENVLTGEADAPADVFGGGTAVATHVFARTEDGWRLWIRHASPVLSGQDHEGE